MPCSIADFRRLAVALPGAIESSHMNHPDFRHIDARGNARIFATLAYQEKDQGVLKLTLEQQQSFIADLPAVFSPVHGGWGRMGMTLIHLAAADPDVLQGALATAHRNLELKHQTVKPSARSQKALSKPSPKKTAAAKSPAKETKPKPAKAKSPRSKA